MIDRNHLWPIFMLSALFCVGCSPSAPEGFPAKLVPCRITITKGATPVAGATVCLFSDSANKSCVSTGITNEQGVAEIITRKATYAKPGVPPGKCTMTLSKNPRIEGEPDIAEMEFQGAEYFTYMEKRAAKLDAMPRIFPSEWDSPQTSPLTIDVGEEGGDQTIDATDSMEGYSLEPIKRKNYGRIGRDRATTKAGRIFSQRR